MASKNSVKKKASEKALEDQLMKELAQILSEQITNTGKEETQVSQVQRTQMIFSYLLLKTNKKLESYSRSIVALSVVIAVSFAGLAGAMIYLVYALFGP